MSEWVPDIDLVDRCLIAARKDEINFDSALLNNRMRTNMRYALQAAIASGELVPCNTEFGRLSADVLKTIFDELEAARKVVEAARKYVDTRSLSDDDLFILHALAQYDAVVSAPNSDESDG